MAENKKSFIAYVDWKETFDSLPDDKAGQLIKHIFAYINDENPKSNDILINAVFANIKHTLKRDLRKYEIIREKRVIAGKASADKKQHVLTSVDMCEQVTPVSVSVNDSVNDTVNVKEKNKNSMPDKPADFIDSIVNCFIEEHGNYEIITPGKEREMAGKILGIYKKKFPAATSEETLTALRIYFKQCININDDWLRANMSLSTIVTKFNVITKILKNGNNRGNGATSQELTEMLARKIGIKR
jgi:hypothetical protein